MVDTDQDIHPRPAEPEEKPTLELRRVTYQDLAELVDLLARVLPTIKTYENIPVSPDRIRTLIQANLDNPDMFGQLLDDGQRIVGIGLGFLTKYGFSTETHAQDMILYIDPEYRSIRVVKRMVDAFCTWAEGKGVRQIFISNTAGIDPAIHARLMARFGFEDVGHTLVKGVN